MKDKNAIKLPKNVTVVSVHDHTHDTKLVFCSNGDVWQYLVNANAYFPLRLTKQN